MGKRFLCLFLFCSSLVCGQQISSKRITRQIKKIPAFQKAHVAISISALGDQKEAASYQGSHYMTPASNVKLLSFLAAKQQFNKLPAVYYFKENDRLIHFKATGYPLLLHPFYPEKTLNSFLVKRRVTSIILLQLPLTPWVKGGLGMTTPIIMPQSAVPFLFMVMLFRLPLKTMPLS